MAVWQVDTVVDRHRPRRPRVEQGHDPVFPAAFMTAALGRRPTLQAGAWVWDNVQLGLTKPLVLPAGTLATCTGAAEGQQGALPGQPCRWWTASAGEHCRATLSHSGWDTQAPAGTADGEESGRGIRFACGRRPDQASPAVPPEVDGGGGGAG